jgi:L-amino acid N-acyltransferase YncA
VVSEDTDRILDIYRYYILNSTITFEERVPSGPEFQKRIDEIASRYPFIVAESGGEIAGFAYATTFRNRSAYRWAVEVALYVDLRHQGKGIGKKLLEVMLDILFRLGYYRVYAVITLPNERSTKLFESAGFRKVGYLQGVGFKHGVWCDVDIMEKSLRDAETAPAEPVPFLEFLTKSKVTDD